MIPAFLGVVILMVALGAVGLGLGLVIVGRLSGRTVVVRTGLRLVVGAVMGWAGAWLVGWVTAPRGVVPLGEEIAFCGIDCHLHVSAVGVSRGESLVVRLRFRSDAKAADEFPGMLRFALRGSDGRRRAPAAGLVTDTLAAGAIIERELRFATTDPAVLEVTWDSWLDYLVPGAGNVLVQRLRPLGLSRTG